MSEQEKTDQAASARRARRPSRRRWWWVLVLGLVLGGIWGGWWWNHRLDYHLIGIYYGKSFFVRDDGFLFLPLAKKNDSDNEIKAAGIPLTLQFHDWQGGVRWQIVLPSVRPGVCDATREFKYSPDGHYIACKMVDPSKPAPQRVLVVTWQGGREIGRIRLPEMGRFGTGIFVINDGRVCLYNQVFCDEISEPELQAHFALARGSVLLATGQYAAPRIIGGKKVLSVGADISQDLHSATIYYEMEIASHPDEFSRTADLHVTGSRIILSPYSANQEAAGAAGCQEISINSLCSPWRLREQGSQTQVYLPKTGEAWPIPAVKDFERLSNVSYITGDGRYVIYPSYEKGQVRARMCELLNRIPILRPLADRLNRDLLILRLYERPGILRAQLRCTEDANHRFYHGNAFQLFSPKLSQDGQHMVLSIDNLTSGTDDQGHRTLVFSR